MDILPPRVIAERAQTEVTRLDRDIRQIQDYSRQYGNKLHPHDIDAMDAALKERGFWNSVRMLAENAQRQVDA